MDDVNIAILDDVNIRPILNDSSDPFLEDVSIIHTLRGELFILVEEGANDKIIPFGTLSNIIFVEAECLYMDGTFQTCPCLFYQIFSIHIVKYGQTYIAGEKGSPKFRSIELELTPSHSIGDATTLKPSLCSEDSSISVL